MREIKTAMYTKLLEHPKRMAVRVDTPEIIKKRKRIDTPKRKYHPWDLKNQLHALPY